MSEMVERLAKALYDDAPAEQLESPLDRPTFLSWDDLNAEEPDLAESYRSDVRLVLRAMREPTKAQLSHAAVTWGPWGGHGERASPNEYQVWQMMIDGALKEEPKP